jgi:nicotinamidase-related amidase
MAERLNIDKTKTALVVVDLQKGIVAMPAEPHLSNVVVNNVARLVMVFHRSKMPVFLTKTMPSLDLKDALQPLTDSAPVKFEITPNWSDIVPALSPGPNDFIITKRQWSAFYGTELDLELRRRGITTIVLCGIATNIGVESTARTAYECGYNQIFVEDAMTAHSQKEHDHVIEFIFQKIGRVRETEDVLADVATLDVL